MARSGLGKGLGALIGTPSVAPAPTSPVGREECIRLSWQDFVPSTLQPRKRFGREALQELIDDSTTWRYSTLIVRQVGARFETYRRRAPLARGTGNRPCHCACDSSHRNDVEVLELSLIENLQRADLNPIEEAQGYAEVSE